MSHVMDVDVDLSGMLSQDWALLKIALVVALECGADGDAAPVQAALEACVRAGAQACLWRMVRAHPVDALKQRDGTKSMERQLMAYGESVLTACYSGVHLKTLRITNVEVVDASVRETHAGRGMGHFREAEIREQEVGDVGSAELALGRVDGVVVAHVVRVCPVVGFSVPQQCRGLPAAPATAAGRETAPVWLPGFHFAGCCARLAYLVTEQPLTFLMRVSSCRSKDNVMVDVEVAVIFRICTEDAERLKRFVYDLTPAGLHTLLRDVAEEHCRAAVVDKVVDNVADLSDAFPCDRLAEGMDPVAVELAASGVVVERFLLLKVCLPPEIQHHLAALAAFSTASAGASACASSTEGEAKQTLSAGAAAAAAGADDALSHLQIVEQLRTSLHIDGTASSVIARACEKLGLSQEDQSERELAKQCLHVMNTHSSKQS